MTVSLDPQLNINYRWALYHYDSVTSSVFEAVVKEYLYAFIATSIGVAFWLVIARLSDNNFFVSMEFKLLLSSTASGVFLWYGNKWSNNVKNRFRKRTFHPNALTYIPLLKIHLQSDFSKKLCVNIESGKTVYMSEIEEFIKKEKEHLGIALNKRISYVQPEKKFLVNARRMNK